MDSKLMAVKVEERLNAPLIFVTFSHLFLSLHSIGYILFLLTGGQKDWNRNVQLDFNLLLKGRTEKIESEGKMKRQGETMSKQCCRVRNGRSTKMEENRQVGDIEMKEEEMK